MAAQTLDGSPFRATLDGFPARVFLHEYDHLQGTLFIDRMETGHRAVAEEQLAALAREFDAQCPGAKHERSAGAAA